MLSFPKEIDNSYSRSVRNSYILTSNFCDNIFSTFLIQKGAYVRIFTLSTMGKAKKGSDNKENRSFWSTANTLTSLSPNTLRQTTLTPHLDVSNSALQSTGQVDMEQRPRESVHHGNPVANSNTIGLTSADLPPKVASTALALSLKLTCNDVLVLTLYNSTMRLFHIPRSLPLDLLFIFPVFSCVGGAVLAANLGN